MTYFELFNLPASLDISLAQLKSAFLAQQQQHHPDKAENKDQALIQSSEINQAYKTLYDIDTRAGYLLKLKQQDQDLDQSIHDFEFLQSALEIREKIEDATTSLQLQTLKSEVNLWITTLIQSFKHHYEIQQWNEARDIVRKLKFFQRILIDIGKAEDALFDDDFDLDNDF